jgi:hypothetical protein
MPTALAYAGLNLRCNPFGELSFADRAAVAVAEVARWTKRLGQPGFALQFLGPSGRGKTSHLLALRRCLPDAALMVVPESGQVAHPASAIVLIDEAQYLGSRARRKLFRPCRSLALAGQADFTPELVGAGFEVETVHPNQASAERVMEIARRRIELARRGPGPLPELSRSAAERLLARHGNDLRAIEGRLYAWIQSGGGSDVEV